MKIMLFLQELAMGGTTVNAIELATSLRDRFGHEVVIFSSPGPLLALVQQAGLRSIPAPRGPMHPCLARVEVLRSALRTEHPDLLYVWESWALADAILANLFSPRVPLLLTDMQMFVGKLVPKYAHTTFGTPELVEQAKRNGVRHVDLLVPPVDLEKFRPGAVDPRSARLMLDIGPHELAVVLVSRLIDSMKGESLSYSIEAVGALGARFPLRLVIVGDGSARNALEAQSQKVNASLGRRAVSLFGPLLDPRPAYAAADIVIGMGGSALRGMAFGKPLIVVGEAGFATTLEPSTASYFLRAGLYGKGRNGGDADLIAALECLAGSSSLRKKLSEFSLEFVRRHYSLEIVSEQLESSCRAAVDNSPSLWQTVVDAVRLVFVYVRERRFLWRAPPAEPFVARTPQPTRRAEVLE